MKSENNRRPVGVEDLLRLKRAERPPAEFWTEFDRQLRAKQLAALVTRRPWWQNLPRVRSFLPRYRLVFGASAMLALGFFSLRQDESSATTSQAATGADVAHASAASEAMGDGLVARPVPAEGAISTTLSGGEQRALASTNMHSTAAAESPPALQGEESVGGPENLVAVVAVAEPSDIASYLPASLGTGASASTAKRGILSASTPFEARVTRTRSSIEPLQQMTPPGEPRRSNRLLTAMVTNVSAPVGSFRSNDRNNRLDEEQLYDQVRRLNAKGVGVELKF